MDKTDIPPKKLAFAVDVAGGASAVEAYARHIARPGTSHTSITANAHRLMADPEVRATVERLRQDAIRNTTESARLFIEELLAGYREIYKVGLERYTDAMGVEHVRNLGAARGALDSMHRLYQSENSATEAFKLIKALRDVSEGYFEAIKRRDWEDVTQDILGGIAMNKKEGA